MIKKGVIGFIVFVVVINIIFSIVKAAGGSKYSANQTTPTQSEVQNVSKIEYKVVDEKDINGDSFRKVITVDSKHFNETDLTQLGKQLNEEAKNKDYLMVMVYDNEEAAKMLQNIAVEEDKSKISFYDQHFLARYLKNDKSNLNSIVIYLDGVEGKNQKEVQF